MADERLTLRPSMRTEAVWFGTSTLAYALFIIPFLVWLLVGRSDPQNGQRVARVATLAGGLLVLALANAVVLMLARVNRAIFVDDESLGEVTWMGHHVTHPRAGIAEVRRLSVRHKAMDPAQRVVVVDKESHRVLDLRPSAWNPGDIEKFCARLGLEPVGSYDDVLPYQEFDAKYPVRRA